MEIAVSSVRRLIQLKTRSHFRTLMMTAQRCEKVLEELKEKNPYFEKYADKIAKLQQTSPEEFLSRVEEHKKKKAKPKPVPEELKCGNYSQLLHPKKQLSEVSDIKDKPLSDVMKIDLIQDKSTDEIKAIWEAYHREKTFIAATVPSEEYDKLRQKGMKYPTFLLPLPRSQGYEFIMCQFQNNVIHFTPLLYYQVHKENAPECLTLTYYTEFKEDKGLVLMRGEYNTEVLDAKEAICLANQILLYYGKNDEEKDKLLEIFNNKPDEFKHMDLIKQIENLSL